MKTTINIPDKLLEDAISFSGSRTKREVVVTALTEFNQRHRMARLVKAFGTCARVHRATILHADRHLDWLTHHFMA